MTLSGLYLKASELGNHKCNGVLIKKQSVFSGFFLLFTGRELPPLWLFFVLLSQLIEFVFLGFELGLLRGRLLLIHCRFW